MSFDVNFAKWHDDLAKNVLMKRYFWKDESGTVIESWSDMCWRVAKAVAAAEKIGVDVTQYEEDFFNLMLSGDFLPNSPVLMNFGQPGALGSACFVLPIEDDMGSIFGTLKNTALIHRDGGGTGFNFSRLRPFGAKVKTHGQSSGVVSFMSVYNAAGMVIEQGGKRRGANMGMLNVDHPEIIKFIRCKEKDGELSNFNISVAIDDDFMSQVIHFPNSTHMVHHGSVGDCILDQDGQWYPFHASPEIRGLTVKEVFDIIVEHAWNNGEPGVFFIDRANDKNPVLHLGYIESTNPCGEYAAIPYSSCNLGSINLSNMVVDSGVVDYDKLSRVIRLAVRFLDNVIDVNTYPIPEIEDVTKATRPIGLGVMGFADMLLKLGIRYGSQDSIYLASGIMEFINANAHHATTEIAVVKGSYPESCEVFARNCQVTTIAPTGTISILAGCSSGIEPVFSWGYNRRAAGDTVGVQHPIAKSWIDNNPGKDLPDYFVTAQDVSWSEHIAIQAAFQAHCDNGVSKTINMSHEATKEDVARAISKAWQMKCNGITIYRDGSRSNQVLEVKNEEPETITLPEPAEPEVVIPRGVIVDRPRVTDGSTGRYKVGCGSLYITYNHLNGVPCEVFVNASEHGGCAANSKALGMLISLALRAGVEESDVIRTLRKVNCAACRGKKGLDGKSCADVIARAMVEMAPTYDGFYVDYVPEVGAETEKRDSAQLVLSVDNHAQSSLFCPECNFHMFHEGGCVVCHECGYTKCS